MYIAHILQARNLLSTTGKLPYTEFPPSIPRNKLVFPIRGILWPDLIGSRVLGFSTNTVKYFFSSWNEIWCTQLFWWWITKSIINKINVIWIILFCCILSFLIIMIYFTDGLTEHTYISFSNAFHNAKWVFRIKKLIRLLINEDV